MDLLKISPLFSLLFMFGPSLAHAEEPVTPEPTTESVIVEPLITDRPDVAESSRTVGKGTFQVEAGVDISDPTRDERVLLLPYKIRQGVTPNFEFHIESDVFLINALELGSKWHIGHTEWWSLGLLTAVSIPFKDDQSVAFSPTLAADFDLGRDFGLGTNLGASIFLSPRDTNADSANFAVSLGKGWSDDLGTFIEGFGEVTFSGTLTMATDAGVVYRFNPNMQVDAYVRQGFYQRSDLGFGAGFSFRL